MAVVIKTIADITKKWTDVTPMRAPQYQEGVEKTTKDWAAITKASEDTWKTAITAAAAAGRFGKGVIERGTDGWKKRTVAVGPERWSRGVAIAGPEYTKGFAPYREVIAGLTLPPKFAKGDLRNYARVQTVGVALRDKKVKG